MKKQVDFKNGFGLLQHNHRDFLSQTKKLERVLTNLRYEGKISIKKNISAAQKVLHFYKQTMRPHILVEDMFFAFVEKHIPRVQMAVRYLATEHKEMMRYFKEMERLIQKFSPRQSEAKQAQFIERLKDKGTYLIYLMRQHIQMEHDSIYKISLKELHLKEKECLLKRMQRCPEWKILQKKFS